MICVCVCGCVLDGMTSVFSVNILYVGGYIGENFDARLCGLEILVYTYNGRNTVCSRNPIAEDLVGNELSCMYGVQLGKKKLYNKLKKKKTY
jgi:hypothetical protein